MHHTLSNNVKKKKKDFHSPWQEQFYSNNGETDNLEWTMKDSGEHTSLCWWVLWKKT